MRRRGGSPSRETHAPPCRRAHAGTAAIPCAYLYVSVPRNLCGSRSTAPTSSANCEVPPPAAHSVALVKAARSCWLTVCSASRTRYGHWTASHSSHEFVAQGFPRGLYSTENVHQLFFVAKRYGIHALSLQTASTRPDAIADLAAGHGPPKLRSPFTGHAWRVAPKTAVTVKAPWATQVAALVVLTKPDSPAFFDAACYASHVLCVVACPMSMKTTFEFLSTRMFAAVWSGFAISVPINASSKV